MTVPPKDESNGYRDFLIVSLFGQDDDKTIGKLTQFMGYSPFCRYQDKIIDEAATFRKWKLTDTFEWDRINPRGRLEEITNNETFYDIIKIAAGFLPNISKTNMAKVYQTFTSEIIAKWEEAVQKNPDAEWSDNKISDILPFIKTVKPRITSNQSAFGFSILSLDRSYEDEPRVIAYGLEPLVKAEILTNDEANQIGDWYKNTSPSWDSNNLGRFEKNFAVDGHTYKLITDCYRGCRDLNLLLVR
jgi:hypothetical protein